MDKEKNEGTETPDFDFSVLFADEEEGGIIKMLPILNSVLLFIILLLTFFKK